MGLATRSKSDPSAFEAGADIRDAAIDQEGPVV